MTIAPQPAVTTIPGVAAHGTAGRAPIEFIYGSGAGTDEVYFSRRGAEVFELPVVWLAPQNCWGASLINPHETGDRSRPLSPQCLECHTVWVDYRRGSLNEYGPFTPQLLGVTCERCHGPADKHVQYHRNHPAETAPTDIVRPRQLSRDRLMDLCAQCHTNSVRYRRPPFSFRPGEALEDSFHVLEMQYPEQNRVANQVRYLKESRCYLESDTLTCITCHDPHRRPDREDTSASHRSCLTCHQPEACGAQARLPAGLRKQCATCHMPRRNKVQVNFQTAAGDVVFPAPRYEHRIAVYPDAELELLHQWYGDRTDEESAARRQQLGTELHEHWKQFGDSVGAEHRWIAAIDAYRTALRYIDSGEVRAALADMEERNRECVVLWFDGIHYKQQRRLDEAIATFQSLLAIQPDSAKAHYELGTLYAAVNRRSQSLMHLELARQLDPNDPGPEVMLGWLDFLDGKPASALEHYLAARQIEPWSERIEHMVGQCLAKLGRWEDAAQAYQQALTIDPHCGDAALALRGVLRERLAPVDALSQAVSAVKATSGQDAGLLLTLAEIYRDLGRDSEAVQTLAVARAAASDSKSSLLPQIQKLNDAISRSRPR